MVAIEKKLCFSSWGLILIYNFFSFFDNVQLLLNWNLKTIFPSIYIVVLFEIYFFIDTLRYMHVVYWCHSKIRRTQKTSSCSCSKFLILIRNVQIEEEEVLLGRLSLFLRNLKFFFPSKNSTNSDEQIYNNNNN